MEAGDIARTISIDAKTLRKHCRRELDIGHIRANVRGAEGLLRQAAGDGHKAVTPIFWPIFWLKARAGRREGSGAAEPPLTVVVRYFNDDS